MPQALAPIGTIEPDNAPGLDPIGTVVPDPEDQKDAALRTIFDAGLTKAADEHAGVLKVAEQLQVPAALVAERWPEFKRAAQAAQFDPRRFRAESPELAAFLLDRPTLAPVVRDDSANLTGLEYALTGRRGPYEMGPDGEIAARYTPPFWGAVLRDSVHGAELAMRQSLDLKAASDQRFPVVPVTYDAQGKGVSFEAEGQTYNFPPGLEPTKPVGPPAPFSPENTARIEELRSQVPQARDYGIDEIAFRPARAVAHAVSDVVQFVPAMGGMIASGVVGGAAAGPPGAVLAPFAFNYLLSAGPEYAAKREALAAAGKEGDPGLEDEAVWAATLGGTTNAAIMSVGAGPIARGLGARLGLSKLMSGGAAGVAKVVQNETVGRVILRGAREYGTHWAEGVATMVAMSGVSAASQEAFRSNVAGDEFHLGRVGDAMWQSGKDTALSMAILSGLSMPVRQYLSEVGQARLLDQNAGRLREAVARAQASKSIDQAPGEVSDLIGRMAKAGSADTVYVEKAEFDRLYQAKGVTPREVAARFLGDGGKAWDEAQATGGDIPVPAEVFLTKMARTADGLALADISRLPQDARSPRQTREVAREVGRKIKEQADAAVKAGQPTPHDFIVEDFKAKALAAGRSELEAKTNAEVVARAFTWFGAQTGRDPMEVYRTEIPAEVHAGGAPAAMAAAAQLAQPAYHGTHARDIERFTLDKIGSGTGIAAEGFGVYASSLKDIADLYRERLAAQKAFETGQHQGEGQTYGVDVPDDHRLLQLREPVSAQHPEVRAALEKAGLAGDGTQTGKELYLALEQRWKDGDQELRATGARRPDEAASRFLAGLGIQGGTYPAETAPGGARGRNFVVWDEGALRIVDRLNQERIDQGAGLSARLTDKERGFIQLTYDAGGVVVKSDIHLTSPDRSTLPHELMHFFTEVMGKLVETPEASAGLKENYQTLLRAMGYGSPQERAAAATERRQLQALAKRTPAEATRLKALVGREERVSHMWEQFLFEGKAPTQELLPIFARFKTWFRRVYRSIEGLRDQYRSSYGEDLNLTEDVRNVFRRMLASDEAVADAARQADAEAPLVKLTPEEQAQAAQLRLEARTRAEGEVQQLLRKEERGADREFMATARARLTKETEARLAADPTYTAIDAIQKGEAPKIDPAGLDPDVAKALPKDVTEKGGAPADVVAAALGFGSGDELVRALVGAEPRKDRVAREVGNQMRELYPSLAERPRLLAAVAAEKLHDAAFLREGVIRLRAMAREAGVEASVPSARELAASAEEMIKGTSYSRLRPDRFDLAAKAAARRAAEAKDPKQRAAEYETYLFNRALQRAAADARGQAETDAAVLQRMTTDRSRAKVGKATELDPSGAVSQPYLEKRDELLAAFEFRAGATRAEVQNRGGQAAMLRAWIEARWADGDQVVVPDSLLAKLDRQTHWKDLTATELHDLRQAAESITQQATLRSKFRVGTEQVATEQVISELVDAALKNGRGITTGFADNVTTLAERAGSAGRKAQYMVEHPELLLRGLDGHKDGPWQKYVWNVLSDASYRFYDLVRSSSGNVQKLLRDLPAAERARLKRQDIVLTGQRKPYSLENVVAALANCGNESNLSKLVRGMSSERVGYYRETPWNGRTTLDELLSHATQREVDLAQKMIDAHESYWPAAEALEKTDSGIAPPKVQARVFKFQGAGGEELTLKGGYYPVIYSRKFKVGKQQAESDAAGVMGLPGVFNRAYDAASTPQGHLQARIETYARPLDLTLDALPRKLAMTAKDIAFRMDAKQVYRVLTDDRVMGALHQAVGEEGYRVLIHHLQDSVNDVMLPDAGAGMALGLINKARGLVSEAIFGLNVAQTMQNLADTVGVKAVVPQGRFMAASLRIARSLERDGLGLRSDLLDQIRAESPHMRLLADGHHDSVSASLHDAFRKSEIAMKWEHAKALFMVPFETTNAMVEVPVYLGAKDHALAPVESGGLGLSEADAIRHGEQAVRTLFGSKRTVDLSPIQRDKILRHFTMFYGWANAQLNLFLKGAGEAKVQWSEGRRAKALATVGGAFALLWAKQMASEVLVGHAPEDSEGDGLDAADIGKWAAWKGVMTVPLSVPVVGSFVRGLQGQQSRDISLTPWTAMLNAGMKAVKSADKALSADTELTDDQEISLFLAWMEFAGQATGAPVAQLGQTARYWQSRTGNEGVPEDIYGTGYGPPRSGKLNAAIWGE